MKRNVHIPNQNLKKPIPKLILGKLREKGLNVVFYKISSDYETGEKTLIVKTSSFSPFNKDLKKLNAIENEVQEWINHNFKNWFIMLIPIGRQKRRIKRKRKIKNITARKKGLQI
jgi:hypothetical protein